MTRANGPGRIATVLRWPLGIAVVSWRYMWRTTPCIVQRGQAAPPTCRINGTAVGGEDGRQGFDVGSGPLLHRTYTVRIAGSVVSSTALIERVEAGLDRVSPEMAVFRKVRGDTDRLQPGDEFVVRVPGPWGWARPGRALR
jgi:hypothetical protein